MVKLFAVAATVCAILTSSTLPAAACTGIRLTARDGSVVYARTLEFGLDLKSRILFLPRNFEFSGSTASGKPGLSWRSQFAAVGMNAYGLELLLDGVNEHGLSCGAFYMPGFADYQPLNPGDEPQAIAPWEVVTWILTSFTNVDEARAGLSGIRVAAAPLDERMGVPPLHFVAHDRSGKSLVVEYVDGQLRTYDNPIGVITNSPTFDWHVTNLRNYINLTANNVPPVELDGLKLSQLGQGSGLKGLPGDFTPPSRFVRAVALSQDAMAGDDGEQTAREAFHVLDSFDIPRGVVRGDDDPRGSLEYTQWTSAADLHACVYYFHTYGNRRIRSIHLMNCHFDVEQPIAIAIDDDNDIQNLQPAPID